MSNRLHKVLGGHVQCRHVRHTRTIYGFPWYCLGLRMRQKVFFAVLHHFIPFIDPTFAKMLRFADFYADRQQTIDTQGTKLLEYARVTQSVHIFPESES